MTNGILVIDVLHELERELLLLPFAEAALLPFGEVYGIDGIAFKVGLQNGLNLGQSIEPLDEGLGLLAVLKALVDLFANGVGQMSDFSVASSHMRLIGLIGLIGDWRVHFWPTLCY